MIEYQIQHERNKDAAVEACKAIFKHYRFKTEPIPKCVRTAYNAGEKLCQK